MLERNPETLLRPTWTGPILVVAARTLLLLCGQAIFAGILALGKHAEPWSAAGAWWTVFGSIADLGCLGLMVHFTRKEGLRFRDLLGSVSIGRDFLRGLGYFFLIFPIHMAATFLSSRIVYGSWAPMVPAGQLHMRVLPVWAVGYSLSLWWILWSATEETTYQAYALPRLQALSRPWIGIAIVWFFWTLQHCVLPLVLDWNYVLWRFLAFAPGMLPTIWIYHRRRRLTPMIVAHGPMDLAAAATTMVFGRV